MKNCDEQFLKINSNVTVLEPFLKKKLQPVRCN